MPQERSQPLTHLGDRRPPGSPPAIWRAFQAQAAWKSWALVVQFGVIGLLCIAVIRLAAKPPEFVLVDANGETVYVKRSVATDALLAFLQEKTQPPKLAVVRFTRDFLRLAVAVNSSTIEANWPAALSMMGSPLREKIAAESAAGKLVETYKAAQKKTDLRFEEVELVTRTKTLLAVKAIVARKIAPLVDGTGPGTAERIQIDLVEKIVPVTVERPDGLEVVSWGITRLDPASAAGTASQATENGISDNPLSTKEPAHARP